METISIHARFEADADAKLAKLARRAAKYGQAISWSKTPRAETRTLRLWDGSTRPHTTHFVDYAVTGEAPRVGEFTLVASLERVEAGVIVTGGEVGALGREWEGRCEHCNSTRARKVGFVVEGAEGRRVVGKSCLRDHLGTDAPAGALWFFTFLSDVRDMADEESGYGRLPEWHETTLGVVAASRASIALWGWVPSSMRDEAITTAEVVTLLPANLSGSPNTDARKTRDTLRAELARSTEYAEQAAEVISWGAALEPKGDYEHNLKVALACEFTRSKTFGLVVSASAAFDRQQAREVEARKKAASFVSAAVGQLGERLELALEVTGRIVLPDNGFGPSWLFVMRGEGGERLTWKTGTSPRIAGKLLAVGDAFRAKATVKAYSEFRGVTETRLARVKEVAA